VLQAGRSQRRVFAADYVNRRSEISASGGEDRTLGAKMSYYFSKTLPIGFDTVLQHTIDALKAQGFGIITEIDVKQTLKSKLGVDFQNYRILGACNPKLAHEALSIENKIGTMLPCNVVVQELGPQSTEVAAIDPVASMQAIDNPKLKDAAARVRHLLRRVIETL
jgi:uncharacterized protein (DUF302 family)